MRHDLAAALRRATEKVRASDPQEATAVIRKALRSAGLVSDAPGTASAAPVRAGPSETGCPGTARDDHRTGGLGLLERFGAGGALRGASGTLRGGLPSGPVMPGTRAPSVPVPEGARYETRSHACAAGARDYRLYVPSTLADGARGLVVMLHGCKQNPDDFAVGTGMNALAERHGLIVAYPAQTSGANVSACWNWFDPAHQRRDAGEPAILAGIAAEVAAGFAVPEGAVFVAGLSAGGAMAAVLAATYPDVFAAAGIHSGLAHGAAHDVASAFAAMRGGGSGTSLPRDGRASRLIVLHGTADRTVAPANAEAIADGVRRALPPAKPRVRRCTAGGRDCTVSRIEQNGRTALEVWMVEGAGHAWSGGEPNGSYTDASGPDASAEMVRFFLAHEADGGET